MKIRELKEFLEDLDEEMDVCGVDSEIGDYYAIKEVCLEENKYIDWEDDGGLVEKEGKFILLK